MSSLLPCSPVALAGCCWAQGGQAAELMGQPLPLPTWTSLFPPLRDWISVSMLQAAETNSSPALAGLNPGLCGSAPYCKGSDIYFFFLFFCRWGRSVGTFSCLSSVCTRRISCWECWREALDSESGFTAWQGRP